MPVSLSLWLFRAYLVNLLDGKAIGSDLSDSIIKTSDLIHQRARSPGRRTPDRWAT